MVKIDNGIKNQVDSYIRTVIRNVLSNHYGILPRLVSQDEVESCIKAKKVLNLKIVCNKIPYINNGNPKFSYNIYFLDTNTGYHYYSNNIG